MSSNTLPVLLVSAKDLTQAKRLASELVDIRRDTSDDNVSAEENFIWQLINKYYCANVRIHPLGDDDPVPTDLLNLVEAHIIYIPEEESDMVIQAEKRAAILRETPVDVYLLLYEGSHTPSALATWACNNHYEVVALKETKSCESDDERDPDDDLEGPFKETYGIERARETLHAHTWTGLQRIDIPSQIPSLDGLALSSDEDWVGGDDDENDENDMEENFEERAEAFAEALEAICRAKEARGEGDDETRRRRAEMAVNVLRNALGANFDRI